MDRATPSARVARIRRCAPFAVASAHISLAGRPMSSVPAIAWKSSLTDSMTSPVPRNSAYTPTLSVPSMPTSDDEGSASPVVIARLTTGTFCHR